jgi:hypothetical protein
MDEDRVGEIPPPIAEVDSPVEAWRIEQRKRIMDEKIKRIQDEETQRRIDLEQNRDAYELEAQRLLTEIKIHDPNDRWQYRKGLRLMFLGTKLGNAHYKAEGEAFLSVDL